MNGLFWSSNMDLSASMHDLVAATLTELGLPAPTSFLQTMLMKDGYFAGWKFRHEGKLLKTVALEAGKGAAA